MKLDIFNRWRDLGTWSGVTLQYQSSKRGSEHITYVRDADTKKVITYGTSRVSREESLTRAKAMMGRIGPEGVQKAIATGQPVLMQRAPEEKQVMDLRGVSQQNGARKDVDWRDGSNHRYRAQRDLVG